MLIGIMPLLSLSASPPDKVVLIVPADNNIEAGIVVPVGVNHPADEPIYYGMIHCLQCTVLQLLTNRTGLIQEVNISIFASNGTMIQNESFGDNLTESIAAGACGNWPEHGSDSIMLFQIPDSDPGQDPGTYTMAWNFTYMISSDPQNANASYCGPGPFSTQHFLINSTFESEPNDTGEPNPLYTVPASLTTANLPSKPTGNVKSVASNGPGKWAVRGMVRLICTSSSLVLGTMLAL